MKKHFDLVTKIVASKMPRSDGVIELFPSEESSLASVQASSIEDVLRELEISHQVITFSRGEQRPKDSGKKEKTFCVFFIEKTKGFNGWYRLQYLTEELYQHLAGGFGTVFLKTLARMLLTINERLMLINACDLPLNWASFPLGAKGAALDLLKRSDVVKSWNELPEGRIQIDLSEKPFWIFYKKFFDFWRESFLGDIPKDRERKWGDVVLKMKDKYTIEYSIKQKGKQKRKGEMHFDREGMADRRKLNTPDKQWDFLIVLIEMGEHGFPEKPSNKLRLAERKMFEKRKQKLDHKLRERFRISEASIVFDPEREVYKPCFQIVGSPPVEQEPDFEEEDLTPEKISSDMRKRLEDRGPIHEEK